jgi:hypothetical protein
VGLPTLATDAATVAAIPTVTRPVANADGS